eukprot:TRINITY_DN19122_c0_g1_i2.p1 TRINITY_DN19122_c0_g1~~TRINITY_DN19122_c0_g1_i2.p1  ORF type:complete len:706 (-),score=103.88 TRINITY_DN19122_c0_g1_i2:681-2798(-)
MNSIWIGGTGDGGLHERTPYWLNGIVPLAFLLKNAGIEQLPRVTGIYKAPWGLKDTICQAGVDMHGEDIAGNAGYAVRTPEQCADDCRSRPDCHGFVVSNDTSPATCWLKGGRGQTSKNSSRCYGKKIPKPIPVDIMGQVEKYVSYILSHQNADGWLGPEGFGGGDFWGPSNVLQALYQYAEGVRDPEKFKNASQAVLLHFLEQKKRMTKAHLASWAQQRWMDMALTVEWLLDNADVGEHRQDLLDLIGMLHDQGSDWEQWFEHWTGNAGPHNVNNAQGLKSAAVYFRYNRTATYEGRGMAELSKRRMQHLDKTFGLPNGMFNGDELLPDPATEAARSPSRGIELCGIVEAMFSYNTMFSIHGDLAFADRAERIAYNALPATWASPTGGDMWAHPYLEAINEISAVKANPHVWTHDGDLAETYGLEPNYGCCTANFNQGWPKYASMLVYSAPDGGIVVGLWAPAGAKLPDGNSVDIDTTYPFGDTALVTVTAKTNVQVHLRIPGWAAKATVNGQTARNGTMWQGTAKRGITKFSVAFNPTIHLEEWDGGAVSVHRGAILYSLPITPNYTVYAHHFGTDKQSNDYYLKPTSAWQFALDVDPHNPEKHFKFSAKGYKAGAAPFNHSNWPTEISAVLRPLPSWGVAKNSAAVPPSSPACRSGKPPCGDAQAHRLVPHGGTELRIGEMPLAEYAHADAGGPVDDEAQFI